MKYLRSIKVELTMKLRKSIKIKSEVREALKNIGLTDYLINIYIGLLKKGEMNARELSELTQVPYSRIYEVLNEMVHKKMITKIEGRPSTFLPNDPNEVFSDIKADQDKFFQENAKISLPFLKNLFGDKKQAKQENFMIYQGETACKAHIRNILNSTARSLMIAFNNMRDVYSEIQMHLEFLQTKGVDMSFILLESDKDEDFIDMLQQYGSVRFHTIIDQNILISDEKTALQGIKGKFNIANPKEEDYAMFSSTSAIFVMYCMEIFETLWERAE